MDSTFATQCDDVLSTSTVRAEALVRASETTTLPRTAPSNFLLALVPIALKQLLTEAPAVNFVTAPQNEVPGGWSQFNARQVGSPSASINSREAAARRAHPSQYRRSMVRPVTLGESGATSN